MVLQSTGLISLSNIQTEFGGTNPIFLSEYYANSATGYTTGVTGIPNSTTNPSTSIKLSQFYGKAKPSAPSANTWQYFNNSYCSSGEYALRQYPSKSTTTMQDILNTVINTPSYIAVFVYDGNGVPAGTWEVSYVSTANTVNLMYSRYGSMTPYQPNNRYIYVHINKATAAGAYVTQNYATLI